MKLDVNVLRYLGKDDFRTLTAVEMGQVRTTLLTRSSPVPRPFLARSSPVTSFRPSRKTTRLFLRS